MMKRRQYFLLLVLFFGFHLSFCLLGPTTFALSDSNGDEKLVLVATSSGGGGHMTAAHAVKDALEQGVGPYRFKVIFVDITELTAIGKYLRVVWDDLFVTGNYSLLRFGAFTKSFLGNTSGFARRISGHGVEDLSINCLKLDKRMASLPRQPDLIISVFNAQNNLLMRLAQKLHIPFRIVPTDFNSKDFLEGIVKIEADNDIAVYLPLEHERISRYPERLKIPHLVTGYPLKAEFLNVANAYRNDDGGILDDIAQLKKRYEIMPYDRSIFVMMGAKGFDISSLMSYLVAFQQRRNELWEDPHSILHLMVATGTNQDLQRLVDDLEVYTQQHFKEPKVRYHALPLLSGKEVALHMAASDLVFTKPGGATTSEVLAINKGVVFSLNPIAHETFNAKIMTTLGWGKALTMSHRKHTPVNLFTLGRQSKSAKKPPPQPLEEVIHLKDGKTPSPGELNRKRKVRRYLKALFLNRDLVNEKAFVNAFRPYLLGREVVNASPRNEFHTVFYQAVVDSLEAKNARCSASPD